MFVTYILPNYKAKKMAYRNRLIVLVWSIYLCKADAPADGSPRAD
jgi:hypothetical protein